MWCVCVAGMCVGVCHRKIYLEVASWTQFRWFLLYWQQHPEHIIRSQQILGLVPSRSDQGIDLGYVNVVAFLYPAQSSACWLWHSQWTCICCCVQSSCQTLWSVALDEIVVASLFLLGSTLLRMLGLQPKAWCPGPWVMDESFFGVVPFSTACLTLKVCFGFSSGGWVAGASFFTCVPSWWKVNMI